MESFHSHLRTFWSHEPKRSTFNAQLSTFNQCICWALRVERWAFGVPAGSWRAFIRICARFGAMNRNAQRSTLNFQRSTNASVGRWVLRVERWAFGVSAGSWRAHMTTQSRIGTMNRNAQRSTLNFQRSTNASVGRWVLRVERWAFRGFAWFMESLHAVDKCRPADSPTGGAPNPCASSRILASTRSSNAFGVDVPAVIPTVSAPANQSGQRSAGACT